MDVREKLAVIAHLGDHISYKEDIGICYDSALAKVIEDAYMALKNGVTVQDNTEISDELLKQLRNASLTVLHEEPTVEFVQEWISVDERIPQNFVSVLGYMTDAGEFPPVRECYTVGNAFFFPALGDVHPVSHWCELPQPPKGE